MVDWNRSSANHWEELRREARLLENEIDSKLLSFSKLASRENRSIDDEPNSESLSLLGDGNDIFERITSDIEQMLNKLTDINNKMSIYSKEIQNPSVIYTVQRHREILNDYSNEFRKTRSNIAEVMERERLLKSNKKSDEHSAMPQSNKIADLYMKEQEHLRNSEVLIEEQLSVASRTRESLLNQRTTFKAIQTKMTTLANRFPMINSLIHRINVRRKKDSIIIGVVIAICLFLLILYIF